MPIEDYDTLEVDLLEIRETSIRVDCDDLPTFWIPRSVLKDDIDSAKIKPGDKNVQLEVAKWWINKQDW